MAMGFFCASGRSPGNALLIEQGALYPGLFRLVRQGLLKASWGTSENNRQAKFYELTVAGRKRLQEETDNWNRLASAIGAALCSAAGGSMKLLDSLRFRLPHFFGVRRSTPRWTTSSARTSSTAPTIWNVPACPCRGRAAGAHRVRRLCGSERRMPRSAGERFSRSLGQDVRLAFGCCASLRASRWPRL